MQTVTLNLTPTGVAPVVYASQYDDGRVIRFKLVDGDINNSYSLNGLETITAKLTKPDGTETTIAVTNPGSGKSYVDLVNGASDYDQAGVYLGEVVLTRNATVLGTGNFVLEVEADAYGSDVEVRSASGIIATFNTALSEPLVSLKCNFLCSGGNGTPSTPIPLVPFTELNVINVSDTDLASALKNVYEGKYGFIDLGSLTWIYTSGEHARFETTTALPNVKVVAGNIIPNALCSKYKVESINNVYLHSEDNIVGFDNYVWVYDSSAGTDANAFKTAMSGKYLLYELATETTPSITETDFNNIVSSFNANGDLITIDLNGTRYGGYVDVNNGKLVVTHGFNTYDGSNDEDWGFVDAVNRAYISVSDINISTPDSDIADVKANMYSSGAYSGNGNRITGRYNIAQINVFDSSVNNISEWRALLSNTPMEVAYELATPIEVDITPAFLSAIVGQNNVFHDGNGTVELEYLDLKE